MYFVMVYLITPNLNINCPWLKAGRQPIVHSMSETADKMEVGRSFIFAFSFTVSLLASIYRLQD